MTYYHIVCILQANPSCEKILNHILQSDAQLSPLTTGCGWRVGWSLMAPSVGWVSGILGFWSYGVSYSAVWFISSFCDQRLWQNMISGDYSNFMSIKKKISITKVPCPQGREPRLLKYMVSLRACWSTRSSWTKAEMDEIWNSRWRDWACRKKKYSNLSGTMFKHALIWWSPTTQDFCGMNSPANPRSLGNPQSRLFKNMMDHGS